MKTLTRAILVLFSFITAAQADNFNLSGINTTTLPAHSATPASPAQYNYPTGLITDMDYLARTKESQLFSYCDTEQIFKNFTAFWKPILEQAGLKPEGEIYNPKGLYGELRYTSNDASVVREFMAEKMHYDALKPEEMKQLQLELSAALDKNAMRTIAAFNIKNNAVRPTFKIYYLTKPETDPAKEIQLRQLSTGDDIDFELLENSVQIVKKDASFSLVYIGKSLGMKNKIAETEAGIQTKLEEYKKFLTDNKMEFIASKIIPLKEPFIIGGKKYNYTVNIYFFQ